MAKKLLTPGQKRKRFLMVIIILLAFTLTVLGAMAKGGKALRLQKLVKDHGVAIAEITDLEHKEVKVKKKKRRKTKHIYTMDIQFQVNGVNYNNTYDLPEADFARFEDNKITKVEVWYDKNDPSKNYTQNELMNLASQTGFIANMGGLAIVIFPIAIVVYMLIAVLFIKEPKGYIPEGFVTENSWFDVDDNYIVVLETQKLIVAKIDDKHIKKVQKLYQDSAPIEEILETGKCKVTEIALSKITNIESEHYSDSFMVKFEAEEDEKNTRVEFLNPTVKDLALERISVELPKELEKSIRKLTRFQSTIWSIISMVICGGLLFFFIDAWFMVALGGLGLFFAVKSFLKRLVDPTVITEWKALEPESSDQ